MGSNLTSEKTQGYGGLIVPLVLEFWEDESTIDWSDPYPGRAVPGRASDCRVIASGEPTNNDTLQILAAQGGNQGAFGWKESNDTDYRGHEPCNVFGGLEEIAVPSGVTPYTVSLVAHRSGAIVALWDVTVSGTTVAVYTSRRDPLTASWSTPAELFQTTANSGGNTPHCVPCGCEEVDGTIGVFAMAFDGSAFRTVKYESRDSGSTWSLASRDILPDTPGNTALDLTNSEVTRLSVATSGVQWMLLYSTVANNSPDEYYISQLFSTDGVNFTAPGTVHSVATPRS